MLANAMEKDEKHAAAFSAAPEMESGSEDGAPVVAESEGIKRDLQSRHIT